MKTIGIALIIMSIILLMQTRSEYIPLKDLLTKPYIKASHTLGIRKLNKEVCHENLSVIHSIFEKHGVFFWLSNGTALGFARDSDFISHDDDVDIGMFSADCNKLKFIEKDLLNHGFRFVEKKNDFWSLHRNNELLDIDVTGPEIKHCVQLYGKIDTRCSTLMPHLKTFNNKEIRGKKYNIPCESYMEFLYGPDWKIPKKN